MSESYYDTGSISGFLQELDKEKAKIIITKEFRKFKKPTTIINGLENIGDATLITRELKIKLGTGGTYKNRLVMLQGDHRNTVRDILIAKGINQSVIEVR